MFELAGLFKIFLVPRPLINRCETFELHDRVTEACEVFMQSSSGADNKLTGERTPACDTWVSPCVRAAVRSWLWLEYGDAPKN